MDSGGPVVFAAVRAKRCELLLIVCGDIETNPGPTLEKKVAAVLEVVGRLEAGQARILSELKSVRERQDVADQEIKQLMERVTALETAKTAVDSTVVDSASNESLRNITDKLQSITMRCDDAENRQRRDNLLFFGIDDEDKEDWATSEQKIITFCSEKLNISLTNDHFERVHRLGKYNTDKQRPIIAKMSSFKDKQKVLSAAHKLKGTGFSIGEDFSPSTRYSRKKLIEFAKRLKKPIKLSVDKLRIDNETYMYDHATDSVILHKT